jgi:hypothetical protein
MTSHPKRPRDPNQLAKSIIDIAIKAESPIARKLALNCAR